jgi:hypothetical protein
MTLKKILSTLIFTGVSSMAFADSGTPDEQDSCRSDVRRFCNKLAPDAGDSAFLACLENNRDALSKKCLGVLMDHGR